MQCLNTINGSFIECKISNYWTQCDKYSNDTVPAMQPPMLQSRRDCIAGNASELMRYFYRVLPGKMVSSADRSIPHIPPRYAHPHSSSGASVLHGKHDDSISYDKNV